MSLSQLVNIQYNYMDPTIPTTREVPTTNTNTIMDHTKCDPMVAVVMPTLNKQDFYDAVSAVATDHAKDNDNADEYHHDCHNNASSSRKSPQVRFSEKIGYIPPLFTILDGQLISKLWWQPNELAFMKSYTRYIMRTAHQRQESKSNNNNNNNNNNNEEDCYKDNNNDHDDDWLGIDRFMQDRILSKKRSIRIVLFGQQHPKHIHDPTFLRNVSRKFSYETRNISYATACQLHREIYNNNKKKNPTMGVGVNKIPHISSSSSSSSSAQSTTKATTTTATIQHYHIPKRQKVG